jgi:hypothetical protein
MAHKKEKREFLRRDCLMLCRCEAKGFRPQGHITDISCGGAGIVGTKKPPAQGAELLVTLLLPWKRVELPARVAWVKAEATEKGLADLGVEFLDTLSERQDKLAEFLPQTNTVEG